MKPVLWTYAKRVAMMLASFALVFIAAMLWSIWRSTNPEPVAAGEHVGGRLDVISLQIDILSLTMSAVGIGLGVIALFGYQALKEAAEARAEQVSARKADEVATRAVAEHIEKLELTYRGFGALRGSRQASATTNVEDVILEGDKEAGDGRDT